MPYLKIQPDTYRLSKKQMFDFATCQFCGSERANFQRLLGSAKAYASQRTYGKLDVKWKRTCPDCKKTTALVLRDTV